ncbi:unnamed protein product [Mytilus coruscus]|uniref:Uncharacterized protein n=1 Tax=Mytilus coruscus TaxID=42192 RepID=A0A6J8BVI7_MYTCO|nr:unnamed protein product [Mytilus coruscus]
MESKPFDYDINVEKDFINPLVISVAEALASPSKRRLSVSGRCEGREVLVTDYVMQMVQCISDLIKRKRSAGQYFRRMLKKELRPTLLHLREITTEKMGIFTTPRRHAALDFLQKLIYSKSEADYEAFLKEVKQKATGESKPIPYSSVLKGKIQRKLDGLPIPVKEPSNCGISDLKKILDSTGDIKFVLALLQFIETQASQSEPGSTEDIVDSIISDP